MKQLIIWSIAALALTGAGVRAQENIVLGQSVPLSGTNAQIGKDMRDGALAVFARVNAGNTLGGRKIQLVSLDNANARAQALTNTNQLLSNDKVVALFGYNSATTSLDALPLIAAKGMALFAPFTGSPSARDHANVFTVRASYLDEAKKIVETMTGMGSSKALVVYYDDEAGRSNWESVNGAFPAQFKPRGLAVKRNVKLSVADFESVFKEAPHYVLFTTQFSVVGEYMQAAKTKGVSVPVAALSFVNPDELGRSYGLVARGAMVSQVMLAPSGVSQFKNAVVQDCAKLLKEYNETTLNYTSLESCIAAKALVRVMQGIGGPKVNRSSLLRGLRETGRMDLGGFTLDYTKGNHGSSFVDITFLSRESQFQAK